MAKGGMEKEKKIIGDGTKLSGFVSTEENRPPRQCNNCVFYKHDLCHHPIVMIDPEVPGEHGKPKPVEDEFCCNFFRSQERTVLFVVRHGDTVLNAEDAYRGWEDPTLNDQGRKDAKQAGQFLQGKGIRWIVCSDLKRAVETAQIIAKILNVEYIYRDFSLRPWDVGELAGEKKTKENVAQLDDHIENPHWVIPGGEALFDFGDRVQEAIKFYLNKGEQDGIGLVVTHTSDCIQFNDFCRGEGPSGKPEGGDIVRPGGALRITLKNKKYKCEAILKEKKTAEYGAS